MLLFGLVAGRRSSIPAGAAIWSAFILLSTPVGVGDVFMAAFLGAANTAVGVAIHALGSRFLGLFRLSAPG
jgi:hypothetical protein